MSITNVNDIASGLGVAQHKNIFKNISAPKAAGAFQSGWLATGNPGAGAISGSYGSGTGYISSSATTGAFSYANAAIQNYMAEATFNSSQPGTLIIADRLWSCHGIGFAAGTYNIITPGSLPARAATSGSVTTGTELWAENFIASGASTGSLTVWYTNDYGQPNRVGTLPVFQTAAVIGQMQPIALQAGDSGISQASAINLASTITSGCMGLTILKRITDIECPISGVAKTMDWAALGLPTIPNDACLMAIWAASSATAPVVLGSYNIIDK